MFGKAIEIADMDILNLDGCFNPRVRGTCLVSRGRGLKNRGVVLVSSFNPRVRGTCLVSPPPTTSRSCGSYTGTVSIPVCGEHVW